MASTSLAALHGDDNGNNITIIYRSYWNTSGGSKPKMKLHSLFVFIALAQTPSLGIASLASRQVISLQLGSHVTVSSIRHGENTRTSLPSPLIPSSPRSSPIKSEDHVHSTSTGPIRSSTEQSPTGKPQSDPQGSPKSTTAASISNVAEPILPIPNLSTYRDTDPIITHGPNPLETFIQSDHDLSPSDSPDASNLGHRCIHPKKSVRTICNAKFLVFLFVVLFAILLRTTFYLQEASAKHILDLGERLARRQESGGEWGNWFSGSLRTPKLRLPGFQDAMDWWITQKMEGVYGERAGGMKQVDGIVDVSGSVREEVVRATVEGGRVTRIENMDLDYRRMDMGVGTNTPTGSGEGEANQEPLSPGRLQQDEERRKQVEMEMEILRQKEIAEEDEMVRRAHRRLLNDSKSKRMWYGTIASFLTLGMVFMLFGILMAVICGEVGRLGACPYGV
ncbi:hypothetical protein ABW19_dt0208166 [Dactylella cylindrospora]|nr:hypothetical protein ABW19_dt0208166 [Dactylella cylindrospora]